MTLIKSNPRLLPGDIVANSLAANLCAFKPVFVHVKSRKAAEKVSEMFRGFGRF